MSKRMIAAGHVLPDPNQVGWHMKVLQYEDYGKVSTITKFFRLPERSVPDYPYLGDEEEPIRANLGCATTKELVDELKARIQVDVEIGNLPQRPEDYYFRRLTRDLEGYGRIDYRTVDGL